MRSGWFVLNARDAPWLDGEGRSAVCLFEGADRWPQLGVNIGVVRPGDAMAMYHRETNQEGFLVLHGSCTLVVEGEERELRQWDYFHCPAGTAHTIVGTGSEPCIVVAVGARRDDDWGTYVANDVAARHGASVERDTADAEEAYAGVAPHDVVAYQEGWLPE
jgi:uncharacterized cupin superfamily protein